MNLRIGDRVTVMHAHGTTQMCVTELHDASATCAARVNARSRTWIFANDEGVFWVRGWRSIAAKAFAVEVALR